MSESNSSDSESDDFSLNHSSYSFRSNVSTTSSTSSSSFFEQPVIITREDILEQLEELGYSNVSEDIIQEFMRELQSKDSNVQIVSSPSSSSRKRLEEYSASEDDADDESSSSSSSIYEDNGGAEESEDDSEGDDTQHYHSEETYEDRRPNVEEKVSPPTYQRHQQPESSSESEDDDLYGRIPSRTPITIASNYSPPKLPPRVKPVVSKPEPEERIEPPSLQQQNQRKVSSSLDLSPSVKSRPKTAVPTRKLDNIRRSLTEPPKSSRSVTPTSARTHYTPPVKNRPKPVTYRKKVNDPVSRYHQFKTTWKKDKFLNHSQNQQQELRWQVRKEMMVISGQYMV